jgi:hypothetical protein
VFYSMFGRGELREREIEAREIEEEMCIRF